MDKQIIGYYGKLPSNGDFIRHNLLRSFTEPWDQWLQECLVEWKQTFQKDWVARYLTMPVQHFVLSSGIAGETYWCGILMPSRDQAGRLFPFTIALPVPVETGITPIELCEKNKEWLKQLEQLAISCLHPDFDKEQLQGRFLEELNSLGKQCPPVPDTAHTQRAEGHIPPQQNQFAWNSGTADPVLTPWKKLLHDLSTECLHAYSLWWTPSQQNLNFCQGLPTPKNTAAFIDQAWQHHGWISDTNESTDPIPDEDDTQTL